MKGQGYHAGIAMASTRRREGAILLTLLCSCCVAAGRSALAMETDQFTTPHTPLHDIGPALSRKIAELIEADRTGGDPERVLYAWVGSNIFVSRLGHWLKEVRVADGQVRFLPNVFDSIY